MKKLLHLLALCLLLPLLQAQTHSFVYSLEGEKILFERNDHIQYVHFKPNADTKGKEDVLNVLRGFTSLVEMVTPEIYRCDLSGKQISNFIAATKDIDMISSLSSEYRFPGSKTMRWVFKEMYVEVKDGYSIEKVMQLVNQPYLFAEPAGSFPNTFFIKIENGDIFLAAQRLFETGTVVYAQPSFYYLQFMEEPLSDKEETTTSKSIPKDWNLRGIEPTTMGINAINA